MKPVSDSHLDRRMLEAELMAEAEGAPDAMRQAGLESEPVQASSPSLRYRPFERLAARFRSN